MPCLMAFVCFSGGLGRLLYALLWVGVIGWGLLGETGFEDGKSSWEPLGWRFPRTFFVGGGVLIGQKGLPPP